VSNMQASKSQDLVALEDAGEKYVKRFMTTCGTVCDNTYPDAQPFDEGYISTCFVGLAHEWWKHRHDDLKVIDCNIDAGSRIPLSAQ
jgi:hypothetical protein